MFVAMGTADAEGPRHGGFEVLKEFMQLEPCVPGREWGEGLHVCVPQIHMLKPKPPMAWY